jgi:hypothetical protein
MKFQPGCKPGPGRAKGSRNRLAGHVFEDMLKIWTDPVGLAVDRSKLTKGQEALLQLFRQRPQEFVRQILNALPKEYQIENVIGELSDEELWQRIEQLRAMDQEENRSVN